jgi:Uma2 family endonuclease
VTLRLNRLLKRAVKKIPNPFILYRHTAVAFNEYLKTVPDVSLLHPLAERNCLALYTKMDAALLLEVTEQDTDFTRAHKLPLYARAGIPEAWLVNIPGRRVELHAEPVSGVYQIVRAYQRGETVQAHTLPELSLTVDEILG